MIHIIILFLKCSAIGPSVIILRQSDACNYAWNLITSKPYSLDPNRLYVTYFGGDSAMSIPPDLETKEIWKQIGIKEDRILPFGSKDNFWEMGNTGPCGPCTEIHYDHLGTVSRSNLVNTDLPNLTELWNLVFIQYNKLEDATLIPLKQNFVDTGMGLERLVTILQGKHSNYDTDLFTPLFRKISEYSKTLEYKGKFGAEDQNKLDTHYRILADHVRMIAIAIGDNVFPDESHGLRRVIRKSLMTADEFVPAKGLNLIQELVTVVCEILGPIYPEIINNFKQIQFVMKNEDELWKQVQSNIKGEWKNIVSGNISYKTLDDVQSHGLISAIKHLDKMQLPIGTVLDADLSLILYDRYGLTQQVIDELTGINGWIVNGRQLELDIIKLKERNKTKLYSLSNLQLNTHVQNSITKLLPTDDSHKFNYTRDKEGRYYFSELSANVLSIISSGNIQQNGEELLSGTNVDIILDRTNFWTSLKGDSDRGYIKLVDDNKNELGEVHVLNATHFGSYVIHSGVFRSKFQKTNVKDKINALVRIDSDRRLSLMQNNLASHLLIFAIKSKYVTNVQAFINTEQNFTIKFSIYGQDVSEGDLLLLEHAVNLIINQEIDINFSRIMSYELSLNDITLPTYYNTYSNLIPLITINYGRSLKREVTSGPVVFNSKDIGEFCLVSVELNRKKRECLVRGLTGDRVHEAYNRTSKLLADLNCRSFAEVDISNLEELKRTSTELVTQNLVPMSMRIELNHLMTKLNDTLKERVLQSKKEVMKEAINLAKNNKKLFLVHYSEENSKMEKLTKLCGDLPVMVFAYNNGHLSSRCTVPDSSGVSAENWMKKVSEKIGGEINYYQGHNPNIVCGMKPIKLKKSSLSNMVEKSKMHAELIASELFQVEKR